ncbi:hypothetical protein AX14_003967 [Amanita brunnescens Koide BX004]|nr:hypothetical protein AX14_003967 [Amanita brunnescens Koide BX004]
MRLSLFSVIVIALSTASLVSAAPVVPATGGNANGPPMAVPPQETAFEKSLRDISSQSDPSVKEAIFKKEVTTKAEQDQVAKLYYNGDRSSTKGRHFTRYDDIVVLARNDPKQVWDKLVESQGNGELIRWTTQPGIFMVIKGSQCKTCSDNSH